MRVIKLTAENVKRLSAVEITPTGDLVIVSGRNGQGKTSVLDAIWLALGGAPAGKATKRPIRDGADTASVTVDLGDIRVTRAWAGDTSILTVANADGAKYPRPQEMLNGLLGRLSFDPLEFAQQPEKAQRETLLELIDFDPTAMDAKRADLYQQRTNIGRDGKQLEGQLKGLAVPAKDLPDVEVSAGSIIAELQAAQEARSTRARLTAERDQRLATATRLATEAEQAHHDLINADAALEALPAEDPDVDAIHARLATVEQTNAAIRDARTFADVAKRHNEARIEYLRLGDAIDEIDAQKAQAVREAKMPIEGLGFDDSGVTYNGVPFGQASAAERLRVSLAMAMAMNPTIRVIRITDGSLLDSANMALIEEMAAAADFQVWCEVVDESGKVGIVIEDGAVVPIKSNLTQDKAVTDAMIAALDETP